LLIIQLRILRKLEMLIQSLLFSYIMSLKNSYLSFNLALQIKVNFSPLKRSMEDQSLFRGGWYITRTPYSELELPLIIDSSSPEYIDLIQKIQASSHIKQAVFLYNASDLQFIKKFDGIIEARAELQISHETIKTHALAGSVYKGYLFSYHRLD
jgi:hypothetical protein